MQTYPISDSLTAPQRKFFDRLNRILEITEKDTAEFDRVCREAVGPVVYASLFKNREILKVGSSQVMDVFSSRLKAEIEQIIVEQLKKLVKATPEFQNLKKLNVEAKGTVLNAARAIAVEGQVQALHRTANANVTVLQKVGIFDLKVLLQGLGSQLDDIQSFSEDHRAFIAAILEPLVYKMFADTKLPAGAPRLAIACKEVYDLGSRDIVLRHFLTPEGFAVLKTGRTIQKDEERFKATKSSNTFKMVKHAPQLVPRPGNIAEASWESMADVLASVITHYGGVLGDLAQLLDCPEKYPENSAFAGPGDYSAGLLPMRKGDAMFTRFYLSNALEFPSPCEMMPFLVEAAALQIAQEKNNKQVTGAVHGLLEEMRSCVPACFMSPAELEEEQRLKEVAALLILERAEARKLDAHRLMLTGRGITHEQWLVEQKQKAAEEALKPKPYTIRPDQKMATHVMKEAIKRNWMDILSWQARDSQYMATVLWKEVLTPLCKSLDCRFPHHVALGDALFSDGLMRRAQFVYTPADMAVTVENRNKIFRDYREEADVLGRALADCLDAAAVENSTEEDRRLAKIFLDSPLVMVLACGFEEHFDELRAYNTDFLTTRYEREKTQARDARIKVPREKIEALLVRMLESIGIVPEKPEAPVLAMPAL